MCGIYGYVGKRRVDLKSAIEPIHHRGPDADGYFTHLLDSDEKSHSPSASSSDENKVVLGFKRLAIIDLSSHSNQPFIIENRFAMVFNGEIYNYLELRDELKAKGVEFRTDSDTEVLLKSYIHWGTKCFERFNGMWACIIYDLQKSEITLSRDRFGIKPLYYYQDDLGIHFLSEIKQMFNHSSFKKRINPNVVRDYLESAILDANNQTFFEGVYSFPQSRYAQFSLNSSVSINPIKYWDLKKKELKLSYKDSIAQFRTLFEQSVNLRFRSDVPVGACLSGGLDSSSIVSLAGHLGKKLTTFSVDNKEKNLSEIQYVKDVINKFDTLESIVTFNEENDLELLSTIFEIQDEPISGLGVIAQWRVMKLASENKVTVLLDGQGGDEIFGGYRKFLFFYLKELLRKGKLFTFTKEIFSFFKDKEFNLIDKEGIRRYLDKTNVVSYLSDSALEMTKQHNIGLSGASDFTQKSYEDIYYYSYPQLLRYEDRNSMAFSLESRVPFLDYRLVEFVYSLPASYKLRNGFTKAILRDSLKGVLPDSVRLRRSKLGFATPEKRWMTETKFDYFKSYFENIKNPFINTDKLYRDFANKNSQLDYKSLLRIYLFDRWYQIHFSGLENHIPK